MDQINKNPGYDTKGYKTYQNYIHRAFHGSDTLSRKPTRDVRTPSPDPTRPDPTRPTNFENLLTQAAGRVMASEKSLDIPRFNLAFFVFRLLCSAVVVKAKHTLIRQKESRALRYRGGTFWLPTFSDLRRVPSEHLRS